MQNRFDFKDNAWIPKETRNLMGPKPQIDNFSLRLNLGAQFIPDKDGAKKATLYKRERKSKHSAEYEVHHLPSKKEWQAINFPKLSQKQYQNAEALFAEDTLMFVSLRLNQSENSRLAIGLGNATVFETGITLHHVWGFPYIPASSIKGIVRSWIIQSCFNEKEEDAIGDQTFCDLFGCPSELIVEDENGNRIKKTYSENGKNIESNPRSYYRENDPDKLGGERRGSLLFFDAFPTHAPTIKEDIMNPHYPKYYTGDEPPADYQSPVPIPFLTVENTSFQFLIGFKPLPELEDPTVSGPIARQLGKNDGELSLLEAGKQWLIKALTEHGLGAKTALGYGFFQSPQT